MTTFPKILDCPDIVELLAQIWNEDFVDQMSRGENMNIELIIVTTKQFIRKLYPVIYADEFQFKDSQCTMSAAGDQYLSRKREELVKAALRFASQKAKVKVDRPVESLSTFRPFTVRELDFDVWEDAS